MRNDNFCSFSVLYMFQQGLISVNEATIMFERCLEIEG